MFIKTNKKIFTSINSFHMTANGFTNDKSGILIHLLLHFRILRFALIMKSDTGKLNDNINSE